MNYKVSFNFVFACSTIHRAFEVPRSEQSSRNQASKTGQVTKECGQKKMEAFCHVKLEGIARIASACTTNFILGLLENKAEVQKSGKLKGLKSSSALNWCLIWRLNVNHLGNPTVTDKQTKWLLKSSRSCTMRVNKVDMVKLLWLSILICMHKDTSYSSASEIFVSDTGELCVSVLHRELMG